MLNKEKYKDELEEILVIGGSFAFDKKRNEVCTCQNISCIICKFYVDEGCAESRKEWLNSEYVEPEVDWSQVPVNMKILVRDDEYQTWLKRYFAKYDNGVVYAWADGSTLWSAGDSTPMPWKYAKIAEDVEKPQDNEWHNLKDKKPEDRQEVLTWDGLGVQEDRWSDDADYFESTDAKEIWWREMPEPPEV
ncbi:MAG: hypothetical protein EGR77_08235 [Pseudobutyrivibrio sp.]|nr:hypothetical protein [Pseudobutyrivibrio sp.]